jgi:hypothetical protein
MKAFVHCQKSMENKKLLIRQLGDKLVQMGWFVADSPGLRGTLDFLSQAPEEQIQGLIKACERRMAEPVCCDLRQSQK